MLAPLLAVLVAQADGGAPRTGEAVDGGSVPAAVAPAATAALDGGAGVARSSPEPEAELSRVVLRDGQQLTGVATPTADGVSLTIATGDTLTIPSAAIARVEADPTTRRTSGGETWFRDVNRTRYLYAPSAMMLKRNELFFSQTELLLSGVNWGVTDFLSLQVAGAVPIWFVPNIPQNFNLVLGVKAGASITESFHLAAGAQTLIVPALASPQHPLPLVGLAFGTATLGTPNLHLSLSAGVPFVGLEQIGAGSPMVTLSGNARLARPVALITEHWFVFSGDPNRRGVIHLLMANGLAARIMGEQLAVDVGFVLLSADGTFVPVPIPWLNFVYNWS